MRYAMALLVVFGLALLAATPARAYGTITWSEVEKRIDAFDPGLIAIIEKQFAVDRNGGGVMPKNMGNERIAPYTFYATRRSNGKRYRLDFDQSDDFEFTRRWKVIWWEDPPESKGPR